MGDGNGKGNYNRDEDSLINDINDLIGTAMNGGGKLDFLFQVREYLLSAKELFEMLRPGEMKSHEDVIKYYENGFKIKSRFEQIKKVKKMIDKIGPEHGEILETIGAGIKSRLDILDRKIFEYSKFFNVKNLFELDLPDEEMVKIANYFNNISDNDKKYSWACKQLDVMRSKNKYVKDFLDRNTEFGFGEKLLELSEDGKIPEDEKFWGHCPEYLKIMKTKNQRNRKG